jgi:cell wall-associated NlpC family hydrolase
MKRGILTQPASKPQLSTRCWWLVVLLICICSCAGAPPTRQSHATTANVVSPSQTVPSGVSSPTVEIRLRAAVRQWEGTPHRMGGTRRSGIDCSGFVQRIFGDLFDINLPRSTALQVHTGTAVAIDHLRPGDLVFFHPPDKVRHVGIYLGSGEFAHASASKGVTVSRLNTAYWRNAYWTARRIPAFSG